MVSVVPTADVNQFYRRWARVDEAWDESIKVAALVVPVGKCDNIEYCKSTTIQEWLFNLEIPDILMVFSRSTIYFLATKKKIDFMRPLKDKAPSGTKVKIELLIRNEEDENKANFEKILNGLRSNSSRQLGVFVKDKFPGVFYQECVDKIFKPEHGFDKQDVSAAISYILAVKEDIELQYIQKACSVTETTYSRVLCKELTVIIDKEKKVSHSKLSDKLNDAISKDAGRFLEGIDSRLVDTCYMPIIQSGGTYSLRFAAQSNDDNIHYGSIVSSLGIRYKRYCSNISRTLMIDPNEDQKKNYEFLLQVSDEIINRLCDGAVLSDVYQQAVDFVKSKRPDLTDKLTKTLAL